jgi:hypothetical protein
MQRWAAQDVPRDNPQRRICIDDWFAEELLIAQAQASPPQDKLPPFHGIGSNSNRSAEGPAQAPFGVASTPELRPDRLFPFSHREDSQR